MTRKVGVGIVASLLCLICMIGCGDVGKGGKESVPTESDVVQNESIVVLTPEELLVEELTEKQATGLFVSTFDIASFDETDFETYKAETTVVYKKAYESIAKMNMSLEEVVEKYAGLERIYIGLDPADNLDETRLEALWKAIGEPSDIEVSFLLKSSSLSILAQRDDGYLMRIEEGLDCITDYFEEKENVTLHYIGTSMWLVANEANFQQDGSYTEDAAQKIMLYTFVDKEYKVGRVNYEACMEYLFTLLEDYKGGKYQREALTDYTLVFVGDSVFGRYHTSFAIPGVVANFTGATVYNCSRSGMTAVKGSDGSGFLDAVYGLITGKMVNGLEDDYFAPNIETFYADYEKNTDDEKLFFVVNLGINDYMSGIALETYRNAILNGMQMLKMRYPNAQFLLLTPNYISEKSGGTENMNGAELELEDYAKEMEDLAEELGIWCIDMYTELGATKESASYFLSDGVHPSENGMFLYGHIVANFLNDKLVVEESVEDGAGNEEIEAEVEESVSEP